MITARRCAASLRGLRRLVTIAAFFLVAVGAGAARAETANDRAESRRHFMQAEQNFKQGKFAEALVDYEAGYSLAPLPGFLINIAHCHRLMGDLKKARAYYRKFILISPQSPRRQEVEDLVKELGKAISDDGGGDSEAAAPPAATAAAPPASASDAPVAAFRPGMAKGPQPAGRWWLWTALAASIVGNTVASMAVAAP